jgi:hypothetical protein
MKEFLCKCGHSRSAHDEVVRDGWCSGDPDSVHVCDCDGYEADQGGPVKENENCLNFCPHCGEDLRPQQPAPAAPAPVEPKLEMVPREVTRQEIESLWGLLPLPFGMRPVGVLSRDSGKTAESIISEGHEGKWWETKAGKVTLWMQDATPATPPPATTQPTIPVNHTCSNVLSYGDKENLGSERYGS